MLTLWRNARIATCDEQSRVYERGAVVTRRHDRVGGYRAGNARACARSARSSSRAAGSRRAGRLPHAPRVAGSAPPSSRGARRARAMPTSPRGRRNPEHGARHARRDRGRARGADPAAARLADGRGLTAVEIKSATGSISRPSTHAARGAGHRVRASGDCLHEPARGARAAARIRGPRRRVRGPRLPAVLRGSRRRNGTRRHRTPCRQARPRPDATAATSLVDAVTLVRGHRFSAAQCDRLFAAARGLGLPVPPRRAALERRGSQVAAVTAAVLRPPRVRDRIRRGCARAAGTVAVMLPVAFYALASGSCRRSRPCAAPRAARVASDCNRARARRIAAARHEHGAAAVRHDERGGAARVTRHAARALGLGGQRGALAPGLAADFAVWSIDTPDELGYWVDSIPAAWS